MPHFFPLRSYPWLILVFLIGLGFRSIPILEKQFFKGDEIRSYLAATGHEGEYRILLREDKSPAGRWVSAGVWKRLIQPEPALGYWAVAQDLAMWDVHPPLYFWLLRFSSILLGVNFWSGAVLNLGLEMAIVVAVIALGRQVFGGNNLALWAGALWWLNPASIRVSSYVRPYVLLTLLAVLCAFLFYQLVYTHGHKRQKILTSGLLIVTTTLGLLTHYLFIGLVASAVLVLWLKVSIHRFRLATGLLVAGTIAFGLFYWVYPDFFWAFTFLLEPRVDFWANLPDRLARTAFVTAVVYGPFLLSLLLLLLTQVIAGNGRMPRLTRSWLKTHLLDDAARASFTFCLLAFTLLPVFATDLLYVLLISPHHAMAPHYLNFVTPFVLLLAAQLLGRAAPSPQRLAGMLLVALIGLNVLQLHPAIRNFGLPPRLGPDDLQTSGGVVFDNMASVHWFNLLLHLADEQAVYAANQADLVSKTDDWVSRLEQQGGLYISFVLFAKAENPATVAGREAIVSLINERAAVALRVRLTPLNLGEMMIYNVTPAGDSAGQAPIGAVR